MIAKRGGDRKGFLAAFEPSAKLTDDGNAEPFQEWVERELFRAHGRLDVEREGRPAWRSQEGLHSDPWDMATVWRFRIIDGRVHRLEVEAL
jgi:hypothetical protein